MMLSFDLYTADDYDRTRRTVHVNAALVASVVETERRPAFGGSSPVAVIRMHDGAEHVVYDGARQVARQVADAQAAGVEK
jgi:hypothetical protein